MRNQFLIRQSKEIIFICVVILLVLISCENNSDLEGNANQIILDTQKVPTRTSAHFSPTPSTLASSPTPTSAPTYTPYPTLSLDEVQLLRDELVSSILPTNYCYPPCVWGITPGQSNFWETISIIRQISTSSEIREWDARVFMASIPVSEDVNISGQLNLQFMRENMDQEEIIALTIAGYYYPMFELLNAYGDPTSIYMHASVTPTGFFEFSLYLFYSQKGLVVMYSSAITSVSTESKFISICDLNTQYSPWNSVGLVTWDPALGYSFDDVINRLPFYNTGASDIYYVDLENISIITVSEFYENFSSDNPSCFDININDYYASMEE